MTYKVAMIAEMPFVPINLPMGLSTSSIQWQYYVDRVHFVLRVDVLYRFTRVQNGGDPIMSKNIRLDLAEDMMSGQESENAPFSMDFVSAGL